MKTVDGKNQPFLTPGEKLSVIKIVADDMAFEVTKLPQEDNSLWTSFRRGYKSYYDNTERWDAGIPTDDPEAYITNSVQRYLKDNVYGQLGYGDLKTYLSEYDKAQGAWMPYVTDAVGGAWSGLKDGTVLVWNGTKYVVGTAGTIAQSAYGGTVDWTAAGAKVVYSDETANQIRTYGLVIESPVKQTAQFSWGVTTMVGDSAGGLVSETGSLIGNTYFYLYYGDYRTTVNTNVSNALSNGASGLSNVASDAWNNPEEAKVKVTTAFQNFATNIYNGGVASYNNGELAYDLGRGTGFVLFNGVLLVGVPEAVIGKGGAVIEGTSDLVNVDRTLVTTDRTLAPLSNADAELMTRGVLGGNEGAAQASSITTGGNGRAIAGHGYYMFGSGDAIVPEGTRLIVPQEGIKIADQTGQVLETMNLDAFVAANSVGRQQMVNDALTNLGVANERIIARVQEEMSGVQVLGSGDKLPNYTIKAPDNLDIFSESTTVDSRTLLNNLLQPNAGTCALATCTVMFGRR
jgi:hypothetical protein